MSNIEQEINIAFREYLLRGYNKPLSTPYSKLYNYY